MKRYENADKIRTLYNELQKSLIPDSKEFYYINKYIAFKLYKIHINIFSMNIQFNSLEKLSILVFRSLIEDNGNERFINLDNDLEKEIRFIIDIIKKKINFKCIFSKIIFMQNKFGDNNLFNNFIKSLSNIGIKTDFIFLLLNYINNNGFNLNEVLKIIEPALQEIYPESIIKLDSSQNAKMSMKEFMSKFCKLCKLKRDEQFFEIQWDNNKNDFILTNKSLDEIAEIILGVNENKKKQKYINNILPDKKSRTNISDNSDVNDNIKFKRLTENEDNSNKTYYKDNGDNNINLNDDISKGQDKEKNIILDNQKEDLEGSKIIENAYTYSSNLVNNDDKEKDDMKSKNKDKNSKDKDMLSKMEDLKKMIEMMQVKIEKNETKYSEKLKEETKKLKEETKKLKEEFSKILKEKEIQIKKLKEKDIEFTKKLKKSDDFSKKLSEQLVLSQQEVEDLKLNLKIIRLRTAYKSLIDLIIYIFQLDDKGNLITKIEIIKNYMNGIKNINGRKIMLLIDDINMLLNDANYDAHFIDFNLNLTKQIINSIAQYTDDIGYKEIIGIFQKFNVESEFKELVKIRTNKFKIRPEDFKREENRIINNIKNRPSNKDVIKLFFN